MSQFEDDVLKAHTDQMNGDITPDEYIQEIKRIFENTVSFTQLSLQKESQDNWAKHAKNVEKLQREQMKWMKQLVEHVVETPSHKEKKGR